jgi:hypothetical protein
MEKKVLQEAFASLVKGGDKQAVAELLVEWVQPNHITTDIIGMLMPTRNLKPGDSLVKKVRKGIKVRTLVPGKIHLASEITVSDRINYVLDGADIKVHANAWELESGELGTVDEIRSEMLAKLRDFYTGKVFAALATVWNVTNTPNNFTSVGGPLNATVLENAIDRINRTTSGAKFVVGTRAALAPITKFGGFFTSGTNVADIPDNIREIMRTGFLGQYYGVKVLALDQVYDNPEDYKALIPQDKVVVVGDKVGEFILYGDVKTKQWEDMRPTPPQWYLELYQQFGMIIDNADGVYVIGGLS